MKYNYQQLRYSPYSTVPPPYPPSGSRRSSAKNTQPSNHAVQQESQALHRITGVEARLTSLESSAATKEDTKLYQETITTLTMENKQLKLEIKETLSSLLQELGKLHAVVDGDNRTNSLPSADSMSFPDIFDLSNLDA